MSNLEFELLKKEHEIPAKFQKGLVAADIGHTNTRVLLSGFTGDVWQELAQFKGSTGDSENLRANLESIPAKASEIIESEFEQYVGMLAFASPLLDERSKVRITLSGPGSSEFSIVDFEDGDYAEVKLLNDAEAAGHYLKSGCKRPQLDLRTWQKDIADIEMNKSMLIAGTSLGAVHLVQDPWNGRDSYAVVASEGCSEPAAAGSKQELELLEWIGEKKCEGRMPSYLDIVSGNGLISMFEYFLANPRSDRKVKAEVSRNQRMLTGWYKDKENLPSTICKYSVNRESATCAKIMDFYATMAGRALQSAMLHNLSLGGVYLAGKQLVENKNVLRAISDRIISEFEESGHMRSLLQQTGLYLVDEPDVCLRGAQQLGMDIYQGA